MQPVVSHVYVNLFEGVVLLGDGYEVVPQRVAVVDRDEVAVGVFLMQKLTVGLEVAPAALLRPGTRIDGSLVCLAWGVVGTCQERKGILACESQ